VPGQPAVAMGDAGVTGTGGQTVFFLVALTLVAVGAWAVIAAPAELREAFQGPVSATSVLVVVWTLSVGVLFVAWWLARRRRGG